MTETKAISVKWALTKGELLPLDEMATSVEIDDMGGGAFIVAKQESVDGKEHEIALNPEEIDPFINMLLAARSVIYDNEWQHGGEE